MSLHQDKTTPVKGKEAARHLDHLYGSANYGDWRECVQDYVFSVCKCTQLDKLTVADTLDAKYFAGQADFKSDFKDASTGPDGKRDPFPSSPELVASCFEHACTTGQGLNAWVYNTRPSPTFGVL